MIEIRKIKTSDKEIFFEMTREFFSTDAVLHKIPNIHHEATFDELMRSDEYTECFIFEFNSQIAGYALLAKTFSQEAGGMVLWIEEIYVRKEYRSKGIGKAFFKLLKNELEPHYKRLRLEVEDYNLSAIKLYESLGFEKLEYIQYFKEL